MAAGKKPYNRLWLVRQAFKDPDRAEKINKVEYEALMEAVGVYYLASVQNLDDYNARLSAIFNPTSFFLQPKAGEKNVIHGVDPATSFMMGRSELFLRPEADQKVLLDTANKAWEQYKEKQRNIEASFLKALGFQEAKIKAKLGGETTPAFKTLMDQLKSDKDDFEGLAKYIKYQKTVDRLLLPPAVAMGTIDIIKREKEGKEGRATFEKKDLVVRLAKGRVTVFGMAGSAELKFIVEDLPKLMQDLTQEKWKKIDEHFKVGLEIKIP